MVIDDIPDIVLLEEKIFPSPWSERSFVNILKEWSISLCLTGTVLGDIIAYTICWIVVPEIYIANIAVAQKFREQKVGSYLLEVILERGKKRDCTMAQLEVRASNVAAIALYKKFNFEVVGLREKYYENGEDALLMNLHY